ncbi:MAG: 50S ribosome-binding GTPase [Methanobacteriota archaeon]|nr:MAG: 50S ribosome-binding GTPase [Euryarchaeota archaeon]
MLRIPTILTADEVLDKAFKKASKAEHKGPTRLETVRETNISKIRSASDVIVSTLGKYVKAFPSIERLSPFYAELIDVTIGKDKLKKSLGAIDWCRGSVARVSREAIGSIAKARSIDDIDNFRRAAYGRISSIVKQIGNELEFVSNARDKIRKFPTVDISVPIIVIAGAPNVGKSQLVGRISTGKPRVAVYPFTTQEISVGVFERKRIRYQVIDTPGLLDRPLEERNAMELRAILALKHLADAIVFVIDPSETCGYTLAQQEHLLSSLKDEFGSTPMVVTENKVDVLRSDSDRPKLSAVSGEGVSELVDEVVRNLADSRKLQQCL